MELEHPRRWTAQLGCPVATAVRSRLAASLAAATAALCVLHTYMRSAVCVCTRLCLWLTPQGPPLYECLLKDSLGSLFNFTLLLTTNHLSQTLVFLSLGSYSFDAILLIFNTFVINYYLLKIYF